MAESAFQVPFLTRLRIAWIVYFRHRLSCAKIDPVEDISRFLFNTNEFQPAKGIVRPIAFLVKDRATEHSVFRTEKLVHALVCALGTWRVCPQRKKEFYGYARLRASDITDETLLLKPDERGMPKRHAVITEWPASKEERMSIAQRLAARAEYVAREPAVS